MSKHMEIDLERLQKSILKMAGLVEEALSLAAQALRDRDVDLAQRVIDGDSEIDNLENDVQDECLKILALHQPFAKDLRRIGCVMLISTDLERMGDLSVGVAERAIMLSKPPYPHIPARLTQMTDRAIVMVRKSLDSFVNANAKQARDVIKLDDEVDADNEAIIFEIIEAMKQSTDHIEPGISLFSAVRHVERIADHATNIAEDVIYMVEGEIVRHHPERTEKHT